MSAKQVQIRPRAYEDIEQIYRYSVTHWGEARADLYIYELNDAFDALAENPNVGRNCAFIRPNLFSFTVVSHVVFYKPTPTGIAVIRVLHKSVDHRRHV